MAQRAGAGAGAGAAGPRAPGPLPAQPCAPARRRLPGRPGELSRGRAGAAIGWRGGGGGAGPLIGWGRRRRGRGHYISGVPGAPQAVGLLECGAAAGTRAGGRPARGRRAAARGGGLRRCSLAGASLAEPGAACEPRRGGSPARTKEAAAAAAPAPAMLCYVTRPDAVLMEVEVEAKANGEDCLNQVCRRLGIIEVDYFGLQFTGSKGESLWLNLRNRISQQMDGLAPYRLKLRVKFFVEPHLILQEQTRHIFFLHIKETLLAGHLQCSPEQAVELCALLAQTKFGDYNQNTAKYSYEELCAKELSSTTLNSIVAKHKELEGTSQASAEYQVLQIVSAMENYGIEWHSVRDSEGQKLLIGVGPEGISICKDDFCPINRIAYPVVQMATQSGKNVYLTVTKESGNSVVLLFKMISTRAASGLYRAITETHAFYRCDTVTSAVMMQYSRDLKGHLASLFLNENINLGKKYVFDIKRTSKEVYDHARRALYNAGVVDLVSRSDHSPPNSPLKSSESSMNCASCEGLSCQQTRVLQEKLRKLKEAMLCMVCCEEEIDSTFCPCGHTVCCEGCAAQLQSCPVCRSRVEHVQHVYLPTHTSLLNLTVI